MTEEDQHEESSFEEELDSIREYVRSIEFKIDAIANRLTTLEQKVKNHETQNTQILAELREFNQQYRQNADVYAAEVKRLYDWLTEYLGQKEKKKRISKKRKR